MNKSKLCLFITNISQCPHPEIESVHSCGVCALIKAERLVEGTFIYVHLCLLVCEWCTSYCAMWCLLTYDTCVLGAANIYAECCDPCNNCHHRQTHWAIIYNLDVSHQFPLRKKTMAQYHGCETCCIRYWHRITWLLYQQSSPWLLGCVEGLRGLSPKVGGAPVLELCWDAEARGGARDEDAWGAHEVPQGGLEACDAEVEEMQGALGSEGLGAVRHPRGEGGAPLVVQACHGPLDTVAEGARQGMRLTGKKKEMKKIKLNWTNPILFPVYIFPFLQPQLSCSTESHKFTWASKRNRAHIFYVLHLLRKTAVIFVHFLCRELSLTAGARDWRLSRVAFCCLIVKTSPQSSTPQLKLSAANYTSKLLTDPIFILDLCFMFLELFLIAHWEILGMKRKDFVVKPLPHLFTAVEGDAKLHSPCVRLGLKWELSWKSFHSLNSWLQKCKHCPWLFHSLRASEIFCNPTLKGSPGVSFHHNGE